MKLLFRGFSKDDPNKVFLIDQAPERNIQNFVQANIEWLKRQKFDLITMEGSPWI